MHMPEQDNLALGSHLLKWLEPTRQQFPYQILMHKSKQLLLINVAMDDFAKR